MATDKALVGLATELCKKNPSRKSLKLLCDQSGIQFTDDVVALMSKVLMKSTTLKAEKPAPEKLKS